MCIVLWKLNTIAQFMNLTIHTYLRESATEQIVEHLIVFTLSSTNNRCHDMNLDIAPGNTHDFFFSFRATTIVRNLILNKIQNFFLRESLDLCTTERTVWFSYTCIEYAEVVVNFSNCRYCWTRIIWSWFLINRNSRWKSRDFIHIRLWHLV